MAYMEKDELDKLCQKLENTCEEPASAGEGEFPATEDDDPFDGVDEE